MDIAQITQYFNIGLLVLFLIILIGLFLAGLRGFLRGIWKSTHNMIFMLSLVLISFFTLNALTDFIGSFDISFFWKGSLYITRNIDGAPVTYWVPITSVKETLTEFIKAFYTLYNVSASASSAANFALALTGSVLKIIVFIVDMFLIVTLGNLFSFLSWYLVFQHFIPRVARKLVKLRWVGMIETAVTFIVVTFLFMTPFTSLVNSLNQSYQRNRPNSDNEIVMNIGNFVDAYNNSLFAQILFNWTVDANGMTLDTRLFDTMTTSVSGEYSIGLVGEFANLTNVLVTSMGAFSSTSDSEFAVDPTTLITQDVVDLAFDTVINSGIITSILPVVVEIALNSDFLEEYIPARLIDLSDVDWANEIGYVKDMVDCIFESGVIDRVFVTGEDGTMKVRSFEGNDIFNFINEIVYSDDFYTILDIFKSIDQSKVLSRALPAVLQYVISNDKEGNIKKYLPLSWEEMNEFSWGFETYILFDFLHSTVTLDNDFLKAIFIKAGIYKPVEGENVKALQTLISQHVDGFKALMVGQFDDHGNLVNVDDNGRTIVFNKGQRIYDNGVPRSYCLFDMNLIGRIMPTLLDDLFTTDLFKDLKGNITDEDLEPFHQAVQALNVGTRLKNYKKEFDAILDVVATVAKDEELLDALMTNGNLNSLMKEEGNFFSIEQKHVDYFKTAIGKMDKSSVLYSVLTPVFKSLLSGEDVKGTLNDLGLKAEVLVSAITHDMKRSTHTFFTDLSSLLDRWGDLNTVYSLTSANGDTDALMDKLKDQDTIDAFVRILKTLHNNPIINPTPEIGDTYEKNENLYGLLEFVFSNTESMGLTITRDTLRNVESPSHTWDDEFDAFGEILQFIAEKDIMNASSELTAGLSRSSIAKLRDSGDGNYDIPGLFKIVDKSYIFSSSLGPFLDQIFGDSLNGFLTNKESNVSFENITDWKQEGDNIKNLLDTIYNILPANDEEAKDFFKNFDIKSLDKVVDLNALLHDLANSGIFTYIDENNVSHYQFGIWLYDKVDSSMSSFKDYDLLADPKFDADSTYTMAETWDVWGTRPEDNLETADQYFLEWKNKYNADGTKEETHYIAYKDFAYVNGMANDNPNLPSFWCDYDTFEAKQNAFITAHGSDLTNESTYLNNDWGAYFASDQFISDYDEVFNVDEISRVTRFLTYAMRIMEPKKDDSTLSFTDLPTSLLDGILTAINDTYCMRIGIYNFYRIASGSVFSDYSAFSLDSAYSAYMVNNDVAMYNIDASRPLRQAELDKLVTLYDVINEAKSNGVIKDDNSFDYEKMNDDVFMDKLEGAIKGLNASYVFHRKGSSKVDQLTVFQGMFNSMLKESEIKNIIYLGADSPKDKAATQYNDEVTKIRYLVETCFRPDKEINTYLEELDDDTTFEDVRNKQQNEVHSLLNSITKIYTLEDKDGNPVTNIESADMNNTDNRDSIYELLQMLNDSDLLCDVVPNTIYNLFIKNDTFTIKSGSDSVDFQRVDPFYHYYYNESLAKRSAPDFNARYLDKDINGIYNLLGDYQEYNSLVGENDVTNKAILKSLAGTETAGEFEANGVLPRLLKHLHDCNLFHTPARDHAYAIYYTDKYDDGFTLFEEMISKVCTFVKLDTFAFDASYDPYRGLGYVDAETKMRLKILEITKADDTGSSSCYYHKAAGQAWNGEIDTIMHLAYCSADIGSGDTLDTSTLDLSTLPPEKLKKMLTILNYSDLVADALPKFVEDGFEAIHLGTLTTYDEVNYAYYRLGQEAYGGLSGNAPTGSEIDNIYNIMNSLAKYDGEGNFTGYATNMNNMNDFIKNDGGSSGASGLEGLLKFLYDSRIFNTSLAGTYNEYNTVSGCQISAQGVLLYNSFNTESSKYILSYIARDADSSTPETTALDKIAVFSKIMHMKGVYVDGVTNEDLTYAVESAGLKKLISLTDGNLSATTFTSNTSISNVESHRELITGVIDCAYNATGADNKRSCLVSEIVSGLFNNILENQYTKIDSLPGYVYVLFSFGDANANTLSFASYESLNENEKNGLDGILDCVNILSSAGSDPLVYAMTLKTQREQLHAAFTKMGADEDSNSQIARAVYLAEAHSYFRKLADNEHVVDGSGHQFNAVNEGSSSAAAVNNIYSYNEDDKFSFDAYGQRIETFLSTVTIAL